ncbi:MAG: Hsp70 family protein, partial [Myxococcota bacterium]
MLSTVGTTFAATIAATAGVTITATAVCRAVPTVQSRDLGIRVDLWWPRSAAPAPTRCTLRPAMSAGNDALGAVIGIDLGTTNSVISAVVQGSVRILVDADGNQLHPSAVSFMPTGERLVGHRARARRVIDPDNTIVSAKRIIGRAFRSPEIQKAIGQLPYDVVEGANQEPLVKTRVGDLSVVDIAATVLIFLRQLAENQLKRPVSHCVVTVPANFSDSQREATRQAAQRAGMTVLRILNEPTAAALAYGQNRQIHQRIAVFDLGGGTFDLTLLAVRGDLYEVLATGGDPFLGGDDMDHRIAELLAEQFLRQHRIDLRDASDSRARLL